MDLHSQVNSYLRAFLARKMEEIQQSEQAIFGSDRFNGRQLALLRHALRHPDMHYTAKSHSLSHRVTLQSARNDLAALETEGLLIVQQRGRLLVYRPAEDITALLNH